MNVDVGLVVTLVFLASTVTFGTWLALVARKRRRIVLECSAALIKLIELNNQHRAVQPYPPRIDYHWADQVNSKAKFDRYDLSKFLREQLALAEAVIDRRTREQTSAVEIYANYRNAYAGIEQTDLGISGSPDVRPDVFNKIERKLFARYKLPEPQLDARVRCSVSYTSPKGRNSYSSSYVWNFPGLLRELNDMREMREIQSTAKFLRDQERQRMSVSLRFDVFNRDNHRCVSCGATSDTETLHVDHIHPVSKGGLTEMNNLQTLCQSCNLGKSDRH